MLKNALAYPAAVKVFVVDALVLSGQKKSFFVVNKVGQKSCSTFGEKKPKRGSNFTIFKTALYTMFLNQK
jgi:hypothetical protein